MKRTQGHNVKVDADNTGGFISVDWDCPYCNGFNAGFYFTRNAKALKGDFEVDEFCEDCGKKVTIICRDASKLF